MKQAMVILSVVVVIVISFSSFAGEREDIITRCRATMGEHGSATVKYCADMDIEALSALASYPEKAKPFIARCRATMGEHGWATVKYCADMDIEAEKALGGY